MAFLYLNGVVIPTAKGGMHNVVEVGDRTRAFDGTYIRDTRAYKRQWKFVTKPIPTFRATCIQNLIQGRGFYMPWDGPTATATNGLAATSVGTGITYRSATGGDGAAAFDENGVAEARIGTQSVCGQQTAPSTANLLGINIAQAINTTGLTTANGGTVVVDNSNYWQGTSSYKLTGDGVTANPQVRILTALSGTANHVYTASAYVKGGTGQCYLNLFDNANSVDAHSPTITLNGTWQRVTVSITAGNGFTPSIYLDVVGIAGTAVVYIDGIQVEDNNATTSGNPNPTSFIVPTTSRNEGRIKYTGNPMGVSGMTVNCYMTKPYAYTPDVQFVWYATDNGGGIRNAHLKVPQNTPTSLTFSTTGAGGTDNLTITGLTYSSWHQVTCVIRLNPETGETLKAIYFDGVLKGSSNVANTVPLNGELTQWSVCDTFYSTSVAQLMSRIDDFQILPYPMDATSVAGMTGSFFGIGTNPALFAWGDFVPDRVVNVMGQVDKVTFVGYYDSAAAVWRNNGRVVEFTLEEI